MNYGNLRKIDCICGNYLENSALLLQPTHAYSHIMRAVAAMDGCLALIGARQHGIAVGFMNRKKSLSQRSFYCCGKCKALSRGDCVESGYSEVMIAQFILNCRLFKESANVCWAHVVFNFIHENSYVL